MDGLDAGVYNYLPAADGLERLRDGELPASFVTYLFMGQPRVAEAALLVISVVPGRSLPKYGDRGYRYRLFEAGQVMHSMNLHTSALGLGMFNLGGFYDDVLGGLIRLEPEDELPLYAAAIGRPAKRVSEDRTAVRALDRALPA
jgi:SagB-type dehydrogenase family enzyme